MFWKQRMNDINRGNLRVSRRKYFLGQWHENQVNAFFVLSKLTVKVVNLIALIDNKCSLNYVGLRNFDVVCQYFGKIHPFTHQVVAEISEKHWRSLVSIKNCQIWEHGFPRKLANEHAHIKIWYILAIHAKRHFPHG